MGGVERRRDACGRTGAAHAVQRGGDQAITESVARYTEQVQRYTNLFMGMLGHDIRNPLGTITMSAELLVRSGQLQRKAADPIVNGARRIQSIVELIVDFSRAQSNGVMPITPRASNLRALFDSVLAETQVRHPPPSSRSSRRRPRRGVG